MAEKDPDFIPSNSSDLSEVEKTQSKSIHIPYKRSTKVGSKRRKKRRFNGIARQYLPKPQLQFIESCSITISTPTFQSSSLNTIASLKLGTPTTSSSTMKIVKLKLDDEEKITNATIPNCNLIINSNVLQTVLDLLSICSLCRKGNLKIFECGKSACATKLILKCNACENYKQFWSVSGHFRNAKIKISDNIVVPKRNDMVYSSIIGGRLIGIGCKGLSLYHASLNIPLPPTTSTFVGAQISLMLVAEFIAIKSMENAKFELCDLHHVRREDSIEVVASYDGAYQQRGGKAGGGHSRYCFVSCISVETGKVLSYGVACNSCAQCSKYENLLRDKNITTEEYNNWKHKHFELCPAQFSDKASVHLESAIAPQVISDALSRGVIFSAIISDGDNKTDNAIKESGVYESLNREIERFECLSHVCKRLKINLSKASSKSDKALDTLQSHGESSSKEIKILSAAICGQIASYYRRAVQQNIGNVDEIIRAIHAIPYHLGANDTNASDYHRYCPDTSNSWCKYKAAIYSGNYPPLHQYFLSEKCVNLILNLYSDFGYDSPAFVKKISSGKTSNHNESIHSLLFRMVKKTVSVGMDIMKLGSALAVIRYNDGFQGIARLYQALGIETNHQIQAYFNKLDAERISSSRNIISQQKKRFDKKQRQGKKVNKQISKYGPGYGYESSINTGGAEKIFSTESSEAEDDVASLDDVLQAEESLLQIGENEDYCCICNGTEPNRIIGIGLTVIPDEEEINWIQCSKCSLWYHFLCLGIEIEDVNDDDDDWFCPKY